MRSDPVMLGASDFERIDEDAYFTLDADMCLRALLAIKMIPERSRVYEIAAGRGHLMKELSKEGFKVEGSDLVKHPDPLAPNIRHGVNILDIKSLEGFDAVVTNLPYAIQDRLLEHILPIAERDHCKVAILTRASWHLAKRRREMVHENPRFIGIVHLPRRPYWSLDRKHSPRHDFCWNLWGINPRATHKPAIFYPET